MATRTLRPFSRLLTVTRLPSGKRRTIDNVYTAVYVKRDGAWQLVAYQSTEAEKLPPVPEGAKSAPAPS